MGYLNGSNGFRIFNYNYTTSLGASPVMSFLTDGNVGIGTSTPTSKLNVNSDTVLDCGLKINCQYPSSPFNSYFYSNGLNSNLYGNQFRIYKANGTKTAPSNILKGDLLVSIQGQGYDTVSSWHLKSSSVNFRASENYTSSTTNGGYLTFDTNPDSVGVLELKDYVFQLMEMLGLQKQIRCFRSYSSKSIYS